MEEFKRKKPKEAGRLQNLLDKIFATDFIGILSMWPELGRMVRLEARMHLAEAALGAARIAKRLTGRKVLAELVPESIVNGVARLRRAVPSGMAHSAQGSSENFRTVVLGGLYRGPARERVRSALSRLEPGRVEVAFFADRASPGLVFDVVYRRWRVFPLCEFPALFSQITRIMSLEPSQVVACGDCILTLGIGLIASYHFGCPVRLHLPDQPSEKKQKTPGTDPVVPPLPLDGYRILADPLSPAWRKVLHGFLAGLPDLQAQGEGENRRAEIEGQAKRFVGFFAEFHRIFREGRCAG